MKFETSCITFISLFPIHSSTFTAKGTGNQTPFSAQANQRGEATPHLPNKKAAIFSSFIQLRNNTPVRI
ncbi:MAG: hypothetical protein ACM3YE_15095 [Bacteroidota bacterium]